RLFNFKYDAIISNDIKLYVRPRHPAKYLKLNNKSIKLNKYVSGFYLNRDFKPAWLNNSGFGNRNAEELLLTINQAEMEGLNAKDYYLDEILDLLDVIESEDYTKSPNLAKMDILLTNSFFKYSNHLLHGNPKIGTYNFDKAYVEPFVNMTRLLSKAIEKNEINKSFDKLRPKSPLYKMLMGALEKYIDIKNKGGWPTIRSGARMKVGTVDRRVSLLRKRLQITGDVKRNRFKRSTIMDGAEVNLKKLEDENYRPPLDTFDKNLEQGVKNFQRRHNLIADGIVGETTLNVLNISVDQKIKQIEANLNILRKLPRKLGDRYVLVNIPSFKLYAYENEKPILEMKVIVGKEDWSTPIFSEEISYLVVNPFWNIPDTILTEEFLPNLKEDPNYLNDSNIKIIGSEETIDISQFDWENFDSEQWVYKLRQDPGPSNPLGRLKFMFPNKFNVYLHDTPFKKFFDRTYRSLSHGCVRVEKPLELVDFVLKKDKKLKKEDIEKYIDSNKVRKLELTESVPVHLLYFTVWADSKNVVYFPRDIYNKLYM
ncbi:MAG: L,D-transpeptidase family protein, partial [Candidatus Dadabacteria bacterium]|nr:L,D-transpeptidase family protein [Candidatus Dadabacteria bacterium]NIQ14541.1 L,D-transpeptidase family protein [Candidatus Dadabacteria bacterium]